MRSHLTSSFPGPPAHLWAPPSDVMNEKSVVQVQIYDRSVEEEMFLGMTEIRPRLVNGYTIDQWFS